MLITISPAGRGRYHARLGHRNLCTSRTPFTDAARILAKEGVSPSEPLKMSREGRDTVDLISTVGAAARLTVLENERRGPVFIAHRPFTPENQARVRGASARNPHSEVQACA
jgi:hypothetical protein